MSGIGPIEPGPWHDQDQPPGVQPESDTLMAGSERLTDRWAALPTRRKRATLTLAAVLALTATGGYLYAVRPAPRPAPPAPWPAQSTQITYAGMAEPADRYRRTFAFRLRVDVIAGPPVTIGSLAQNYPGLTTATDPDVPFTVNAGTSRLITLKLLIRNCRGLPLNAGMPFLDVTLRNARAMQDQSYILSSDYASELSAALRDICSAQKS